MIDMTKTIAAKSDQLNADDLIGQSITIKVKGVRLLAGEQPVAIEYEGDNGKPWKPCKSMRRVLVKVWGGDGSRYVGRSMTLYRDESVSFGGQAVGGIRISHMSHITQQLTVPLTVARNSKKPFVVKPLALPNEEVAEEIDTEALIIEANDKAKLGTSELQAFWASISKAKKQALQPYMDKLKSVAAASDDESFNTLSGGDYEDEHSTQPTA